MSFQSKRLFPQTLCHTILHGPRKRMLMKTLWEKEKMLGKKTNILYPMIEIIIRGTFEPQPSTGETQEDMNNVSCRCDMTKILLKAA